jgi:hypothetical protein
MGFEKSGLVGPVIVGFRSTRFRGGGSAQNEKIIILISSKSKIARDPSLR